MRILLPPTIILASLFGNCAFAAEPENAAIEIPLKDIWAYEIPDARDVRELESLPKGLSNEALLRRSLVFQIYLPLAKGRPAEGVPGFAVSGTGLQALTQMRDVMTGLNKRSDDLPAEKEVTIAFFTYLNRAYVRLDEVERLGQAITIKYHFEAHASDDLSLHFALIPLGKLPAGEYEVTIMQLPATVLDGDEGMIRPRDPDSMKRIVCEPFSFHVR